jgi:2-keto-3-deoxy-L-rhamnonate aldolase RhmA
MWAGCDVGRLRMGLTMEYRYPSAPLAKSIIHPGGFNWVLIDGEHGLINDSNYYEVSTCFVLGIAQTQEMYSG